MSAVYLAVVSVRCATTGAGTGTTCRERLAAGVEEFFPAAGVLLRVVSSGERHLVIEALVSAENHFAAIRSAGLLVRLALHEAKMSGSVGHVCGVGVVPPARRPGP